MNQKELSRIGELVRDILIRLVDFPEDVQVDELVGGHVTVFAIMVRRSDQGKVIGRHGRIIEALRRLLSCCAGRDGRVYRVELLEDPMAPSSRHDLSTHASHTEDPVQATSALLKRLIGALVDRPESVLINPLDGTMSAIFEVEVDRDDVRRLLGRRGATADGLRDLLLSMGVRSGRRFSLQILEP